MQTAIRIQEDSGVVIIPKRLLTQTGIKSVAELNVENGAIVLRKPRKLAREGWAEACQKIAAAGDDVLVWPEFGKQVD